MLSRDLRKQLGELVIVGFKGLSMSRELRALAEEFGLGGVILFSRNVKEPRQLVELTEEVQTLRRELPLWISVDQEGGRVARLRPPFTEWPPMKTLGRSGDDCLVERFARALATELSAVGISLDYTPVLDIQTNPNNAVIGDRALSSDAEQVARFGSIIIRTLQEYGVAACCKHFPGHGDTTGDSHIELPVIDHSADRLRAVELVPFVSAIDSGVAIIMTAHIVIQAFDSEQPGTLARSVIHDLLRNEMRYEGLVITDDLEMGAIRNLYSLEEAAVRAIRAGCDLILLCGDDHDQHATVLETLIHAIESDELSIKSIEASLARNQKAKRYFLERMKRSVSVTDRLDSLIGQDEHLEISNEMARYL